MSSYVNPVDPPDLGLLPTFRRLLRLWRREWRLGLLGLSLALAYTLISIAIPILTQRAVDSGELSPRDALDPARRLGDAPVTEAQVIDQMPPDARTLINASIDLHRRVARLDASQTEPQPADSPVQWMQARLAMAF